MSVWVNYTVENRIAFIEINREEKRNALNPALVAGLKEALQVAETDHRVRVIVFGGKGKAFSAGADLAYIQSLQHNTFDENLADSEALKALFFALYQSSKITVAMVEGPALAGGCGLATLCDFVFATPEAVFGYTEVRIGFIPAIVSYFLCRKIGEGKAKLWLLSGDIFPAEKALADGLITHVVPAEDIKKEVFGFALRLANQASGQAISLTKQLMNDIQTLSVEEGLSLAAHYNAKARGTDDCKKGIAAFLNKEKLAW